MARTGFGRSYVEIIHDSNHYSSLSELVLTITCPLDHDSIIVSRMSLVLVLEMLDDSCQSAIIAKEQSVI